MPRVVSFIVLVVILLVIGGLFIAVMAQFLLPIFLAVVCAVIFNPLNLWLIEKFQGRNWAAALLTTLAVLVIVLVPLTLVSFFAVQEVQARFFPDAAAAGGPSQLLDEDQLHDMVDEFAREARRLAAAWGVTVPSDKELVAAVAGWLQSVVAPLALGGVQLVLSVVIGLAIMTISLYYFLLDGPNMIASIMRLSPLDDRYERQLVRQFGTISRAVVLSTLLSAAVQGVLAGFGYWLTGVPMAFLLASLTALLALVPFVGAAAVWVPCCLWLYFADHPIAGTFLLIYGAGVVSMSDNVVKPLVLSGHANLHPLLALLSVLGGVQALGPIGILVGPMAVSFLQALLVMLNSELEEFGKPETAA